MTKQKRQKRKTAGARPSTGPARDRSEMDTDPSDCPSTSQNEQVPSSLHHVEGSSVTESDEDRPSKCPRTDQLISEEKFYRFLVMSALHPDQPLKLNPFAVEKGIRGLAGQTKNTKLPSGDIPIEVNRKAQCSNLLKAKSIANTAIKITPHRTMNFSKGVIHCRELLVCTEEEILAELKVQVWFK